jgi:hypothetical protein
MPAQASVHPKIGKTDYQAQGVLYLREDGSVRVSAASAGILPISARASTRP